MGASYTSIHPTSLTLGTYLRGCCGKEDVRTREFTGMVGDGCDPGYAMLTKVEATIV